jgi:hypothetical protein
VHYVYPFLPPLALAGGLAISIGVRAAGAVIARLPAPDRGRRAWWQYGLIAAGALALALGGWSLLIGGPTIVIEGVRVFRTAGLVRPALIGALLLALARERRAAAWIATAMVMLVVAGADNYFLVRRDLANTRFPLRAIRDCVSASGGSQGGVYVPDAAGVIHTHYYYFRSLGPWTVGTPERPRELDERLFSAGRQTPVLASRAGASMIATAAANAPAGTPLVGIGTYPDVVVWLPGPYAACAGPAEAAGGTVVRAR